MTPSKSAKYSEVLPTVARVQAAADGVGPVPPVALAVVPRAPVLHVAENPPRVPVAALVVLPVHTLLAAVIAVVVVLSDQVLLVTVPIKRVKLAIEEVFTFDSVNKVVSCRE